jgi:hypothetical protein
LQFDLQYLISDVWKLTIVRINGIPKVLAHKAVKVFSAPALLVAPTIWKRSPHKRLQSFENQRDWEQNSRRWVSDRRKILENRHGA